MSANTVFADYIIKNKGDKITIKANLTYKGLEKFGISYASAILLTLIINAYIPLSRTSSNLIVTAKFLLVIIIFILSKILLKKLFKQILAVPILEIDKGKKTLLSTIDKFKTDLSQMKDVSIVEEDSVEENTEELKYCLKFILPDGEKTSIFAFTSYNKLREILNLIKKSKENTRMISWLESRN